MTVLKDGIVNGVFEKNEYTKDDLVHAMMGVKVRNSEFKPFEKVEAPYPILSVDNLTSIGKFNSISFQVDKGDIVGVCGLLGAGKTEIARAIFGLDSYNQGTISIDGRIIQKPSPDSMLKHGVALLTEERKHEGFVPLLSIRENETLSINRQFKETF